MERHTSRDKRLQPSSPAVSIAAGRGAARGHGGRKLQRRAELLSARVDGGVVVYDPVEGVAHHLASPVAEVWDACDVASSAEEVIARSGVPAEDARAALAWLDDAGLLIRTGAALSRRKVLVGAAAFAGTAAASTILLPAAEAAASTIQVQPPGCPHLSAWCYAVWKTTPCYWSRCDESDPAEGSQCVDYSGNRRNGVYQGTCASTSGAIGCDSDPGVHLSGAGSSAGKLCFTKPPSITWACGAWFSPSSSCQASQGIAFLSCGDTATVDLSIHTVEGQACWVITTAEDGKVSKTCKAALGNNGKKLLDADGTGSSTWHFVVLSWSGDKFTVFVDGVGDADVVPPKGPGVDGGDNKAQCFGGNAVTGFDYAGGLDEVMCWESATSDWVLGPLFASSLSSGYHHYD